MVINWLCDSFYCLESTLIPAPARTLYLCQAWIFVILFLRGLASFLFFAPCCAAVIYIYLFRLCLAMLGSGVGTLPSSGSFGRRWGGGRREAFGPLLSHFFFLSSEGRVPGGSCGLATIPAMSVMSSSDVPTLQVAASPRRRGGGCSCRSLASVQWQGACLELLPGVTYLGF